MTTESVMEPVPMQQDHWMSTHDTEDNTRAGRDVLRADSSAIAAQQHSSKTTTDHHITASNNVQGLTFHDEHVLLTYHISNVSLTDLNCQPLTGLTDNLNIADFISFTEVRYCKTLYFSCILIW